jgi:myo-inositol-1-phosphate synthase
MLVGWGGNNGSTLTASIIANREKLTWRTRRGKQAANYFGSLVMSTTVQLGMTGDDNCSPCYVPFNSMVPMVNPNDIAVGGWDINDATLAECVERAQVLEPDLQSQLSSQLQKLKPLPSIYHPDFIARNQKERANNVLQGSLFEQMETIRRNIRDFKSENGLDKVIVLWTANTERYTRVHYKLMSYIDYPWGSRHPRKSYEIH